MRERTALLEGPARDAGEQPTTPRAPAPTALGAAPPNGQLTRALSTGGAGLTRALLQGTTPPNGAVVAALTASVTEADGAVPADRPPASEVPANHLPASDVAAGGDALSGDTATAESEETGPAVPPPPAAGTPSPPGTPGAAPAAAESAPPPAAAGPGGDAAAADGQGAGAPPVTGGAPVAAPAGGEGGRSPAEDAGFQAVVARVTDAAARQRSHMPATAAASSAQGAAPGPANDVTAQAATRQAQRMEQTPAPGFDRAAFTARLREQIAAAAPRNPREAKDFPDKNRLGETKQAMAAEVGRASDAAQGGLRQQTDQPPDTSGLAPKPVGALDVPQQGAAPGSVQAGDAAPKPRADEAVVTPFQQRNHSLDQQMADADITEEQLARSGEPTFTTALAAKREATARGEQAPQVYRQDEAATVTRAQAEAEGVAQSALGGMHEQRGGLLGQVAAAQQQTMATDTSQRSQVASQIEAIYERTRQRLANRLAQMDEQVNRAFDTGAEAARTAFEQYVEDRLDDRYSGLRGKGRWLKDKVFSWGLAEPVARIFEEGRARYLRQMEIVVEQVVDVVERGIADARAIVTEGRQEIATYVEQLPAALQTVGRQAASDIQSRLDELDAGIDARQNELIDSLARRYTEQVQALDARIEELEAEHSSFASKAYSAVKGVVEAILRLKDLLLSVLARAADAIAGIIRDPIGFLGNLINGVKAGLDNFLSKIWDHLSRAMQEWLFGALSGAGIAPPENLDEAGILDLVMQVLGLTYQNIRARAVRIVGEDVVAKLEQFAEPFIVLIREGPGGLWEWIKEQLTNLKGIVLGEIQDWAITKVIKAGIMWILSLLNPAAAFIKACKAIYDIVMFFIERGSQIVEMVSAVVESISAIAKGAVGGVAARVEGALARTLPVVISFLASLLGLSGISDKIRGVIEKLQTPIGNAVDWVIEKSVSLVRGAGRLLGLGPQHEEHEPGGAVQDLDPEVAARWEVGMADLKQLERDVAAGKVGDDAIPAELERIKSAHRFVEVTATPTAAGLSVYMRMNPDNKDDPITLEVDEQILTIWTVDDTTVRLSLDPDDPAASVILKTAASPAKALESLLQLDSALDRADARRFLDALSSANVLQPERMRPLLISFAQQGPGDPLEYLQRNVERGVSSRGARAVPTGSSRHLLVERGVDPTGAQRESLSDIAQVFYEKHPGQFVTRQVQADPTQGGFVGLECVFTGAGQPEVVTLGLVRVDDHGTIVEILHTTSEAGDEQQFIALMRDKGWAIDV